MRNQPLLISVIIAIIAIFILVGASLAVKLSSVSKQYNDEIAKSMKVEEENLKLKAQVDALTKQIAEMKSTNTALESVIAKIKEENSTMKIDLEKTLKVKEALEENLKEQLDKDGKKPMGKKR